jgi:hypothetical protein
MRVPGPLVATGALGVAVLAACVIAIWTSVSHARACQAMAAMAPVTRAIRIDNTGVFAPPPCGVTPAKTAKQAWPAFFPPHGGDKKSPGSRVQLGVLTSPVGRCGGSPSCAMWTIKNGIAYRALNELVYGYSWLAFPHHNSHARDWWFVDANTGKQLFGVGARPPGGGY